VFVIECHRASVAFDQFVDGPFFIVQIVPECLGRFLVSCIVKSFSVELIPCAEVLQEFSVCQGSSIQE
jgi:hypothetical protein